MSSHGETDSQSGSSGSEASFELPDALATGREKRQTAGNRLRDMLNAELQSEDIFAEDEEDEDFGSDQDQQADLECELDSSSDEENHGIEAEDVGELALKRQEKEVARIKKRKATQAFAKPKNPKGTTVTNAGASDVVPRAPKQKRRTGRMVVVQPTRQSSRAHAVEIAADVEKRLIQEAARKSKTLKVAKIEEEALTQDERLAQAKLTEAVNVASLNKIVQYEEEKKANRKLLAARRKAVGPTIRYISTSKTQIRTSSEGNVSSLVDDANPEIANAGHHGNRPSTTTSASESQIMLSSSAADLNNAPSLITTTHQIGFKPAPSFITIENLSEDIAGESHDPADLLFGSQPRRRVNYPMRPACPFSGLPARYQEPQTGLYYANVRAYTSLQQVKTGTVPWNPQLRMYVPSG